MATITAAFSPSSISRPVAVMCGPTCGCGCGRTFVVRTSGQAYCPHCGAYWGRIAVEQVEVVCVDALQVSECRAWTTPS